MLAFESVIFVLHCLMLYNFFLIQKFSWFRQRARKFFFINKLLCKYVMVFIYQSKQLGSEITRCLRIYENSILDIRSVASFLTERSKNKSNQIGGKMYVCTVVSVKNNYL